MWVELGYTFFDLQNVVLKFHYEYGKTIKV